MLLAQLPAINAALNATASVLLIFAYSAIRQKNILLHRRLMIAACCVSFVFLLLYILHKWYLWSATGSYNTHFSGSGLWRILYFVVLLTHVVFAAFLPLLVSLSLWRGLSSKFDKHRQIAKITFPIWLYVSLTGVLVYFMLYHWFAV